MSVEAPAPSPSGLRRAWERLPANAQGAAWLALSAAASAAMLMTAKGLGDHISSFQVVFIRAMASFVFVAGLIPRLSWSALAPRQPLLIVARSALATVSLCLLFYSVAHIPLAEAQALNFANVVFLIPLSVVFLGEKVGPHRWAAVGIGFLGVLIILKPTGEGIEKEILGALAGALGAGFYAAMLVTVRKIAGRMTADATYVWGILGLALMSAPLAALDWTAPTAAEWGLLAGVGALGAFGQYAAVRAFAVGEASAIAPVDYLKLVFALVGGWLLFQEVPDGWTLAGAAAIVGATGYATYREARRRKESAGGSKGSPPQ